MFFVKAMHQKVWIMELVKTMISFSVLSGVVLEQAVK
jgi:hypothetical protein